MSRMWIDGVQRVVHVLQELEEDGIVDDSLCSKITFPGGTSLRALPWSKG